MANNVQGFKDELFTLLSNTTNLDATTKTKIRNRFVSAFQQEWNVRAASGTTDNATNRGKFYIDKLIDYTKSIYTPESRKEQIAALPAPDVLE